MHRDLKPGNVILTKTGAKLLDFGLARARRRSRRRRHGSHRPADAGEAAHRGGTVARHLPVHGPRAARGLRGGRAHRHLRARRGALRDGHRASARSRARARPRLIAGDPLGAAARRSRQRAAHDAAGARPRRAEVSRQGPRRALAERARRRWQLLWIDEAGSQAGVPAPVSVAPQSRERIAWALVAALAVAAAAGLGSALQMLRRVPRSERPPARRDRTAARHARRRHGPRCARPSPDGRRLAFLATGPERTLAVRDLAGRRDETARGYRGRDVPLLVSRQSLDRLLRRPQAAEGRGHRRARAERLRRQRRAGRQLWQGRDDRPCARHLRSVAQAFRPAAGRRRRRRRRPLRTSRTETPGSSPTAATSCSRRATTGAGWAESRSARSTAARRSSCSNAAQLAVRGGLPVHRDRREPRGPAVRRRAKAVARAGRAACGRRRVLRQPRSRGSCSFADVRSSIFPGRFPCVSCAPQRS